MGIEKYLGYKFASYYFVSAGQELPKTCFDPGTNNHPITSKGAGRGALTDWY